jgi:hypothetical protein
MSSLLALSLANARYWPSVAPAARAQLSGWQRHAALIEDPRRRALALAKLREERFNPMLAATLATQAPRGLRPAVVQAVVATQVAYDYRDALQERALQLADDYTRALDRAAQEACARLPGWSTVAEVAAAGAKRCAEAQRRGHQATGADDRQLRRWAERRAEGSGLGWPEWLAGAQASVLGTHALIALAAGGCTGRAGRAEAVALDRLYLSIGALTMLDSLIDRGRASAAHELAYEHWYESPTQMGERLAAAARDARSRAQRAPGGAHHLTTLAGVVAFYASDPRARRPPAQLALVPVRAELGTALAPPLALMRAWRLAARARRLTALGGAAFAGAALAAATAAAADAATGAARDVIRARLATTPASARGGVPAAHSARTLRASDQAHLSYVSASGSTLYETGRASGTLPGSMRVHMRIAATFSGSFTIYTSGGSIAGHGSAVPHGAGIYESFAGSLAVTGGSGRFRHAHGSAKLYGTFNRSNYALVIQTRGMLLY